MACPPSVKLEEQFPREQSSAFAEEGTLAHMIAEVKLNDWINGTNKVTCGNQEMNDYTNQYRDYVVEIFNVAKAKCNDPQILVEQKLDLAEWTVDGFGTGDCIIIDDDTLHIIDLKYGKGIAVSAEDNAQLRLYALGAVKQFSLLYDFNKVDMHIMQPRIDNTSDVIMDVDELIKWGAEEVKPKAELAFKGEGEFNPGEHCQWCKAKGTCKARADKINKLKEYGYMDADLLSNVEIAEVLNQVDELVKWAKDVKDYALSTMLAGNKIDGYKVVEGKSNRKITDETLLVHKMKEAGVAEALMFERKLATLTALEKLVGKKDFATLSTGCVAKPQGAPTLAPESDKRPEFNSVSNDFAEELSNG